MGKQSRRDVAGRPSKHLRNGLPRLKRGRPAGPPKIRVVAFVSPELAAVIYSEADSRQITIGDVVEEAFLSRARMIKKETTP